MVGMSKTDVRIDLNDEKRQESSKACAFHGSTASAGPALAWGLVGPSRWAGAVGGPFALWLT